MTMTKDRKQHSYLLTRRDAVAIGLTALLPGVPRPAVAQAKFPERPIRLIIPFAPGGIYDSVGRPWADKMKALLGTVIVENQGGAGGAIGAAAVARSPADGYTILMGSLGNHVITAMTASHPLYDPTKDLDPVLILGSAGYAFAVQPAFPTATLSEFIAFARAHPGSLSFGSAGTGSLNQLTGELLKAKTGIDIAHVPYRGAGPALTDLISAQISMVIPSVTGQVIELHRSGKIRLLAIATRARLAALPDVPTVIESGLPGFVSQNLVGIWAPAGTSLAIVERFAAATRLALADETFRERLIAAGFEPSDDLTAEQMRLAVASQFALWTPIVKATGLKLE
jgi:tripartite-type tricarboxylate transporter receptor subunit TctC